LVCLASPLATVPAHAWGLAIGIGLPVYPRPYYYPYPYYYRPYPYVYAAPPPVVVAPAPVVVQPAPVVQVPAAPTVTPVPAAPAPALGPPPSVVPASGPVQANYSENTARVDQLLQQLSSPQENVRRDAALDLGRMKTTKAVDSLVRMLSSDSS